MDIIYEDKRIVVAVKPSGILSTDEPGGAPELLRQQLHTECIRTVHRLDAAVSGIMVFARSARASSLLSEQIRQRRFTKEYLAVIHGTPAPDGTLQDLLGRDTKRRITYVAQEAGPDIREASLSYELLQTVNGLSLVRIRLHTGRTHQIRVQFSSRGYPLLGDRKYGNADETGYPIALWSYSIGFHHPETDQPVKFTAVPPDQYPWNLFSIE